MMPPEVLFAEYVDFIGFSQGSLEEVKGDIRELTEDKFMVSKPGSSLAGLGIDLGQFNRSLQNHPLPSFNNPLKEIKGDYGKQKDFSYRPLTILYPPLASITATHLTYEIFMELINKTDWLLRKLVASLETKQKTDKQKLF